MNAFALFGASILATFVSSAVAARLFASPRLQNTDPNRALTLLVAPRLHQQTAGEQHPYEIDSPITARDSPPPPS
jgi:hypothetical protein